MGKKGFLSFAMLAVAGSIAYTVSYLARHDEFSNDTKEDYDDFLKSAKSVGKDLKRTYISIGDKDEWTKSTKCLSKSAMDFAKDTGDLVVNASNDMYNFFANKYTENTKKSTKAKSTAKKKPAKKKK